MERLKHFAQATASAVGGLLLTAPTVLAADIELKPKTAPFTGLADLTVGGVVGGLVGLTLVVAAVVFFFVLVIGGIRWILSGGDKTATEGARSQITAALVGLTIVFAAWAIIQLIRGLFGVNILELTIPSFK